MTTKEETIHGMGWNNACTLRVTIDEGDREPESPRVYHLSFCTSGLTGLEPMTARQLRDLADVLRSMTANLA